jgi:hypothetical protein
LGIVAAFPSWVARVPHADLAVAPEADDARLVVRVRAVALLKTSGKGVSDVFDEVVELTHLVVSLEMTETVPQRLADPYADLELCIGCIRLCLPFR